MTKFINKIKFWYINSRPYSIPITFLSWLVIFLYSLKDGGNIYYGLIAYIGIALVHLSTNLADDYFDYKRLIKDEKSLQATKDIKCKYLKTGQATIEDLRNVIILLLLIAALCGAILLFTSGWGVIIFAIFGLIIALSYSKLSSCGFGDVAVILAYGPLMFEGVYYVMTSKISCDVLILSFGCSVFVNTILYNHMFMDYDEDITANKTTLCTKLKSKENALNFLIIFYITGYLMMGLLSIKTSNYLYMLTFLTIPFVFDLYKLMKIYDKNSKNLPQFSFIKYPFINPQSMQNNQNAQFLSRFIYTRNISTYFMLFVCISILLGK